jgi:hypothetical protein
LDIRRCGLGGYQFYLVGSRPTIKDNAQGYEIPFPAHGPPVHISALDVGILIALTIVATVLFILAVNTRKDKSGGRGK